MLVLSQESRPDANRGVKSPGRKAWVFLLWEWLFVGDLEGSVERGRGESRVVGFELGDLID